MTKRKDERTGHFDISGQAICKGDKISCFEDSTGIVDFDVDAGMYIVTLDDGTVEDLAVAASTAQVL